MTQSDALPAGPTVYGKTPTSCYGARIGGVYADLVMAGIFEAVWRTDADRAAARRNSLTVAQPHPNYWGWEDKRMCTRALSAVFVPGWHHFPRP